VAVWSTTPVGELDLHRLSSWLLPLRRSWYALPVVAIAYVVLGALLVPLLLLNTATGMAFGPWLGPVYAMAGSLTSACAGFAIGRKLGWSRIQQIGGQRVANINRAMRRNGTLAVFLLRKIPAPFVLSNVVAGASSVRFRDFLMGTCLGMSAGVIALAAFGSQLLHAFRDPTPYHILLAAAVLGLPLLLAFWINRRLRERRHG
jgi:uncharacterized membrane protein YdjX (TVP38/TMEM64 family)